MTVLKTEHPVLKEPLPQGVAARLGSLALAGSAAAFGLLFALTVPVHLVPAVVSILSFAVALIVALVAHFAGVDRRAPGVTLWDVAGLFAAIWMVTALLSGPEDLAELFSHLTTVQ